jgi:5-(carboxyamino)imidazole ribonucleotide synthase
MPPPITQSEKRRSAIAPAIGLIGGGQLAKMTAQAASQFGCDIVVLERHHHSPATGLASQYLVGDWNDPACLLELGAMVDVVTLENEFVSANALETLERAGTCLWPSAATMRIVQDKLLQKQALQHAGLAVPAFSAVRDPAELCAAGERFGWPLVLKRRCLGYDGKGNATVRSAADIPGAWARLESGGQALLAEAFVNFTRELAMMITRSPSGQAAVYPVVETVQRDHICHVVTAPAQIHPEIANHAATAAARAVEAVGGVGTFGVEMFLTPAGDVLINELAPRVHNSGHYTIEACACSQFENHVRAVLGWPLGATVMRAPAAVMINLLGAGPGSGTPLGIDHALRVEGAAIHVYGKRESARGRKMGHVTALGATPAEALERAQRAAGLIVFGDAAASTIDVLRSAT